MFVTTMLYVVYVILYNSFYCLLIALLYMQVLISYEYHIGCTYHPTELLSYPFLKFCNMLSFPVYFVNAFSLKRYRIF